jgi:hypothetical protein
MYLWNLYAFRPSSGFVDLGFWEKYHFTVSPDAEFWFILISKLHSALNFTAVLHASISSLILIKISDALLWGI